MFIDKSSRRATVATVLLVATSLTACATSRTAPANAETHTQPVAVTVTPTSDPTPTVSPTPKMEQYVVISASMSNRAYTDANPPAFTMEGKTFTITYAEEAGSGKPATFTIQA